MTRKNTTVRSSAAVTAALLVTALTAGPAMADHDHGQGTSRDGAQQAAVHRQDGRDHSRGRSEGRQDGAQGDRAKGAADGPQDRGPVRRDERAHESGHQGSHEGRHVGRGDERGNGHTPVTVCHLLGNGGYHLLTMDDNALSAHLRHGDVYPDADGACPSGTADESGMTASSQDDEETTTSEDVTEETSGAVADDAGTGAEVAGVEAFARTSPTTTTTMNGRAATVAGVEATRGAYRAAPVAGPLAGILPQTGAGAMLAGALAAGLGLLAGGAALVTRRRQGAL